MRAPQLGVIAAIILCPMALVKAGTGTVQNVTTQSVDRLDITTLNGLTYANCKITRVEPNGITVSYAKGIAKLDFRELPDDLRTKYNYNPTNAAAYTTALNQQQAKAWARRQAQEREVAAAAAAAEQQKQADTLVKKAAELDRKALASLARNARAGKAFTSDCRVLIGCTKETVSATLGTPSMTISSGSTWVFDNLIDPESGRYNSVHVSFKGGTVDDVYW